VRVTGAATWRSAREMRKVKEDIGGCEIDELILRG
jgi:hypothetical protein